MNKPKKERIKKQQDALKLFLTGESRAKICEKVKISTDTFNRWRKKMEWDSYYEQNQAKLSQNTALETNEERIRSLKLIRGAEALIAQKIQSGEIEGININSLAQLQKAKWDILNPRQNQLNLFKQENNIGLSQEQYERLMKAKNLK